MANKEFFPPRPSTNPTLHVFHEVNMMDALNKSFQKF